MTDADVVSLYREHESLVERAAVLERDAALLTAQAQVKTTSAQDLRRRAAVLATQLGVVG